MANRVLVALLALALLALALAAAPAEAQFNYGGGGGASAGVSSISTACPASGPSTGAVTLTPPAGRTVSGATDTLATTDCGGTVEYQNATSTAVSLTAAATLGASWCANVSVDSGAGNVTVTSAGGNFNTTGSTTLVLAAKAGVTICTNAAATGFNVGAGSGFSVPGTNGQILYNNSGTAAGANVGSGLSLSGGVLSATGGGSFQMVASYKSGNWYRSLGFASIAANSSAPFVSYVYCHPFVISSQGLTAKAIGAAMGTVDSGGNASFAIYKADGTAGRPSTLIDNASAAASTTTNPASASLTNGTDTISGGMVWVCSSQDNTTVRWLGPSSSSGNEVSQYTGGSAITSVVGLSTTVIGVSCTVVGSPGSGTGTCGTPFGVWSGSSFTWGSLSGATFTDVTTSIMPEILLQAN